MHIVFVEGYYPRATGIYGGAGIYVQNIGRELINQGHDVSVICASLDNNKNYFHDGLIRVYPIIDEKPTKLIYFIYNIPVIKILSGLLFYLYNGIKIHFFLLKLNRKKKIDFVEYTEGGDFWNAISKRFKYSSHLHGSNYTFKTQVTKNTDLIELVRRRVEHFFIKRANKVISPSNAMLELVEKEMKQKITQAHVIPYLVNDSEIKPIHQKNSSEKVKLIFASRNDSIKGGDIFIKALERLPQSIQLKIKVEFYGYIPEKDFSHLKFLNIHSFVKKDILLKAYSSADICVIPSLFDNSPNTVYEAMAHGKIVVASAVGGIPEIIGSDKNGFLFNPFDINDFKINLEKAINTIINGDSYMIRMNAQKRILSISDLTANTKKRLALMTT